MNIIISYILKKGEKAIAASGTLLACLFLLATTALCAQETTENTLKKNPEEITRKQRFGIRTNAVDWLLTIPNISVEYDLGNTIRSKRTIGAGIKWNWDTSHKLKPPTVFNILDGRIEWRQYFRTRQRPPGVPAKGANLYTRLKEGVFTTKRKTPRTDRAYYWGIYANATNFSLKLGKEGKQGTAFGAGLSLGYTAPLYGYEKGYLDFELGGSIGLVYAKYDVYTHDAESSTYAFDPAKSKGGHLVPFPVVTDLRVAFVYRFMSVSEKYKPSIERRIDRINEARSKANAELNKMRFRIDSIDSAVRKQGGSGPDSLLNKEELKQWKLMQQERAAEQKKQQEEQLRKEAAASLGIMLSDTLTAKQEKAIREEVKKRKEAAEEALKPKKEKKSKKNNEAVEGKEGQDEKADNKKEKATKKAKKPKKEKKSKKDKNEKIKAVLPEDEPKAETPEKKEDEA